MRIPEKSSRMVRDDNLRASEIVNVTAKTTQRSIRSEQRLGRYPPQSADHLGPENLQLCVQYRQALLDLLGERVPVLRRSALEYVADEDVLAAKVNCLDDSCKQLAG